MDSKFCKSSPIPTRFEKAENDFLKTASAETGIPVSELVRRSVQLLRKRVETSQDKTLLLTLSV